MKRKGMFLIVALLLVGALTSVAMAAKISLDSPATFPVDI